MTVHSPGNQESREPENIAPSLLSPPPELCVIVVLCCGQGSQGLSGVMCRCTDVMCVCVCTPVFPCSPFLIVSLARRLFLSLTVHFFRLRTGSRFSHTHTYTSTSLLPPPIHPLSVFPILSSRFLSPPSSTSRRHPLVSVLIPPSRPSSSPPPSPLRAVPVSLSP